MYACEITSVGARLRAWMRVHVRSDARELERVRGCAWVRGRARGGGTNAAIPLRGGCLLNNPLVRFWPKINSFICLGALEVVHPLR